MGTHVHAVATLMHMDYLAGDSRSHRDRMLADAYHRATVAVGNPAGAILTI